MRIKPHVFATALEEAGICKTKMITPNDAVDIQSLLRLTDNKMRDLTLMLKNAGTHIIPSERQRKKVKVSRTTHVAKEKLETGQMYLKRLQKGKEGTSSCPYVKVIDLIDFVQAIYDNGEMKEDPGFKNEVWLLFTGDKSGNSMKFVVVVVNDVKHGSVDNNHIFCLYQASDSFENLWKVFSPYINQVKTMQSPDFRSCRRTHPQQTLWSYSICASMILLNTPLKTVALHFERSNGTKPTSGETTSIFVAKVH